MNNEAALTLSQTELERTAMERPKPPRVWPAVVLVGLFWTFKFALPWLGIGGFAQFLSLMASVALLILLFAVCWLANRRIRIGDRLLILAAAVGGGVVSKLLSARIDLIAWLLMVMPWLFTTWTVWLVAARKTSARTWRWGLLATLFLTWGAFTLIRSEGLRGDGTAEISWRWTPTAAELYQEELVRRDQEAAHLPPPMLARLPSNIQPGDWPAFRGSNRDSVVRGEQIAADWKTNPPKLRWRQRVGPGWSSLAIVGDRLFTQEQRGPAEAVVCLEASTGREIWVHQDEADFTDAQAGPGPRATPTFAAGRIFSLGATGILNCLDAANGESQWSRDVRTDTGTKLPVWGFVSSPLVIQDMVVVSAEAVSTEGDNHKTLLAYRASSGEPAWTADVGKMSYSSPQPASFDGVEQILFFGERGLIAVEPASGTVLWEHGISQGGELPRSLQPHPLGKAQVLIASEGRGTTLIDVKHDNGVWTTAPRWTSRALKPSFNDFVIHDGSIYGFDGGIFCCVDAQTGKRRWKEGRYDHGQVLLLAEQGLLLVISEKGEVILLAANPQEHEERGRFQAIKGKTWNHPVIAHGRLYVRNSEEMACFELAP